jgi:anti-sigma28 factor (negative regulator of flagellin synthesis)
MEVHGPGGLSGPQRIDLDRIQAQRPAELNTSPAVGDRAEISDVARLLNRLAEVPDIRADLVAQLKDLIHSGRYETPERIAAAVDKIMEEL